MTGVYVPGHEARPTGRIRRLLVAGVTALGVWAWDHLPARIQAQMCNCPLCRGEES